MFCVTPDLSYICIRLTFSANIGFQQEVVWDKTKKLKKKKINNISSRFSAGLKDKQKIYSRMQQRKIKTSGGSLGCLNQTRVCKHLSETAIPGMLKCVCVKDDILKESFCFVTATFFFLLYEMS